MNPEAYVNMRKTEAIHWWFKARREIISSTIKKLELPDDAEILEIGCGTGGNLSMLSAFGNVSAIEKDSSAISFAQQKTGNKYDIRYGSCPTEIPFTSKKFDLICMLDVLEHIKDDQETIHTLKKLLKKNGYFLLTVPAYSWLWGAHDKFLHHYRRYTLKDINQLAIPELQMIKISYFNTLLFPIVVAVRLKEKIFNASKASGEEVPSGFLNYILNIIFRSEKHLLNRFSLPFGVSIIGLFKNDSE